MTIGAMKPYVVGFVNKGILCLKSIEFKETIKNAFANDGLFQSIYVRARLDLHDVEIALRAGLGQDRKRLHISQQMNMRGQMVMTTVVI